MMPFLDQSCLLRVVFFEKMFNLFCNTIEINITNKRQTFPRFGTNIFQETHDAEWVGGSSPGQVGLGGGAIYMDQRRDHVYEPPVGQKGQSNEFLGMTNTL